MFSDSVALQVANAVFTFPLAKYAKDGFDLVVGGRPERVLTGDAWGEQYWRRYSSTVHRRRPCDSRGTSFINAHKIA